MKLLNLLLPLALASVAAFADAQPAADAQDIPAAKSLAYSYEKLNLALPSVQLIGGVSVTTYPVAAGAAVIVPKKVYDANTALLAAYKDATQTNLQNVFAGDNPASPTWTVALTFPSVLTRDTVLAQLVTPP